MVDPEVAVSIMELICSEGFLSDALYLLPRWEGVIGCHVCLRFEVSIFLPRRFRFLTDPNCVGFGKVGATDVPPEFLEKPYSACPGLEPYGSLA